MVTYVQHRCMLLRYVELSHFLSTSGHTVMSSLPDRTYIYARSYDMKAANQCDTSLLEKEEELDVS